MAWKNTSMTGRWEYEDDEYVIAIDGTRLRPHWDGAPWRAYVVVEIDDGNSESYFGDEYADSLASELIEGASAGLELVTLALPIVTPVSGRASDISERELMLSVDGARMLASRLIETAARVREVVADDGEWVANRQDLSPGC